MMTAAWLFIYEIWEGEVAHAMAMDRYRSDERLSLMAYSITDADEYGYRGVIE